MAYTFTEPSGGVFDTVSHVRYLVEDETPAAPFSLTDAQIQVELAAVSGDVTLAASNVAFKMAQRYLRQATTSKSVGNLSISRDYHAVAGSLRALGRDLRSGRNTGRVAGGVFTGGTSLVPTFRLKQHDNR